jgi:hypothetical protein
MICFGFDSVIYRSALSVHQDAEPMNFESSFPRRVTEYDFDGENRILEVRQIARADRPVETEHIWGPEPEPPSHTFEHDVQERLFVLTPSDGRTERFRDNPAPHVAVAPDPDTGELRPVTRCGQPLYLYISLGEREL